MANMTYCRFENTAQDLADCVRVLSEWADDPHCTSEDVEGPITKDYELPAAQRIARLAYDVVTILADVAQKELDEVTADDLVTAVFELNEQRRKAQEAAHDDDDDDDDDDDANDAQ
jgi:hypothetical protein